LNHQHSCSSTLAHCSYMLFTQNTRDDYLSDLVFSLINL
jgi:hypothetical protein